MQPKSVHDKENIYRFLYRIWANELYRSREGMDHERQSMKDDLDESAQHLIAVEGSGRIEGCLRVNFLRDAPLPSGLGRRLKITELIEAFGRENVCYASHFTVAPAARGHTVASLLVWALYRLCLTEGPLVGVIYCPLNLVSFYYQLGYRPYTENFRIDAGIRVPLVHCIRDRQYLTEIKSPLARLCPAELDDGGEAAHHLAGRFAHFKKPGFARRRLHHLWARLAHADADESASRINGLFKGLSEEELGVIGRRLTEISFFPGEYIYRRGETEKGMGVILSGSLGVEIPAAQGARVVSVIRQGETFGETSSFVQRPHAADLVALEKSDAFLFSADFLERIRRADIHLGFKLSKRLLAILAGRLDSLTGIYSCSPASAFDDVRVKRPSLYQLPASDEIKSRVESYQFSSLGDQEGEFRRLVTQASVGEDVEFAVLDSAGLRDGTTVLDLGSGPGITSLLLARRLPSATIIGLEPEDILRSKAQLLIESQGFADRCRFLKGSGHQIPLDSDVSDFSYARLLFQHLSNPLEVLGEMQRVTKPGGIVAILDVDDRTNIVHPAPEGLNDLEKRILRAQAAAGGDRLVGRKLFGYMHEVGLQQVSMEHVPITAAALGRENFFSIVYKFKRQVLERAGVLDERMEAVFAELEDIIRKETTFAMVTIFLAHGVVP
jgi:ubiquinone/menaquinone biosynthesis C-methylase UbiE/GNAT superfamily N-acetyltransferase